MSAGAEVDLDPEGPPPAGAAAGTEEALDGLALAADLFNSAIAASALAAAWDTGVLDELHRSGAVDIAAHARAHDLHEPSLRAMLDVLACAGVVAIHGDRAVAGPPFATLYATKGFFVWLLGGCGELLRTAGVVAHNRERVGPFVRRDARVIGRATADFGARFIDPRFDAAFGDRGARCLADLGCGSGDRLIRMLESRPGARGVGIDISDRAVELARERVAEAGLGERVQILQADVCELGPRPELADVDLATCFLMGHDFWPRARCLEVLRRLRSTFPALESLALCDTYRSGLVPSGDVPLLTLGFEYVHALMGKYVPTLDEWREVFAEAGWGVRAEVEIPLPPSTTIFDLVPAPTAPTTPTAPTAPAGSDGG